MLTGAVTLLAVGLTMVATATRARRRRWRQVQPFAGDERGAPEVALVPVTVMYLVYLGWVLTVAGVGLALLALLT